LRIVARWFSIPESIYRGELFSKKNIFLTKKFLTEKVPKDTWDGYVDERLA
jgi:hypothetical protein